jgi:hypothetical protein
MSCREIEGGGPLGSGNVVQLQPAGGAGVQNSATAARGSAALEATSFQPETITRDGLDLLKAFFTIDDAAARAALVILAQRLAEHSKK